MTQENMVLDVIRTFGKIDADAALNIRVRRLAARINALRKQGWGITAWHGRNVDKRWAIVYTFTDRQKAQPFRPVYDGPAPEHSRYWHYREGQTPEKYLRARRAKRAAKA